MDSQEIRDRIMAAINGIIKDDTEGATSNLHDVLAAKMRARINPEAAAAAPDAPSDDVAVDDDVADDDVTDDLTDDEVKEDVDLTEE